MDNELEFEMELKMSREALDIVDAYELDLLTLDEFIQMLYDRGVKDGAEGFKLATN
jgi:hypothetical protein